MCRCRVSDPYTLLPITQFCSFLDVIFMSHSGRVPVALFVAGPQKSTAHLQIRASLVTTRRTCLCQSFVCFSKKTPEVAPAHMIAPLFLLSARWKHSAVITREEGAARGWNLKKDENWETAADVENCTKTPTASLTSTQPWTHFRGRIQSWLTDEGMLTATTTGLPDFFSTAESLRAFIAYKLALVWRFSRLQIFTVMSLFWKWSVDS